MEGICMTNQGRCFHYHDIPNEPFGDEAPGVKIRVLIDEGEDGSPYYVLRMIEIEPGGHTPYHSHPFEHENFVLTGRGYLTIADKKWLIGPGYVAYVPSGVPHMYECVGDEVFSFLCGIPASRLRGSNP